MKTNLIVGKLFFATLSLLLCSMAGARQGGDAKDARYSIANSQWGSVDNSGKLASIDKLREPVILKARL